MYRAEFRRVEGRYIRFEIQVHQSSDSVLSRRSRYPSLDKMKKWTVWSAAAPHHCCSARLRSAHTTARARTPASSFAGPCGETSATERDIDLAGRPGRELDATFVRGWRRTIREQAFLILGLDARRGAMSTAPRPAAGNCARMRCVRRHHAIASTARSVSPPRARPRPRRVSSRATSTRCPLATTRASSDPSSPSRASSPVPRSSTIAQPRRPALASPGAFDAPSKTAPATRARSPL